MSGQLIKNCILWVLRSSGEEVPRTVMEGLLAFVHRADRHGVRRSEESCGDDMVLQIY